MVIFIATTNHKKATELTKYFTAINLPVNIIEPCVIDSIQTAVTGEYMLLQEFSKLVDPETQDEVDVTKYGNALHESVITVKICKPVTGDVTNLVTSGRVSGMIFPNLKTKRTDVFNWDEVFVPDSSMISYQEMQDKGLKNSARDFAMSDLISKLPSVFKLAKRPNLSFTPVPHTEVVSFEPVIMNLVKENKYLQIAYNNPLFRNLINYAANSGIVTRSVETRAQRNYWCPGLNAGIPLTPKKDGVHEVTFMFHDLMHFIFPDLLLEGGSSNAKSTYIITRMMSEAFTLVLADMVFVSQLKANGVDYDFSKRKIYPLIENLDFTLSKESLPVLKQLLWANTQYALLGKEDAFDDITSNSEAVNAYKEKYGRFFQEDYNWTEANFKSLTDSLQSSEGIKNLNYYATVPSLLSTSNLVYSIVNKTTKQDKVLALFNIMYKRLETYMFLDNVYDPEVAYTNAVKRFYLGQCGILYKYNTTYTGLFESGFEHLLTNEVITPEITEQLKALYSGFLSKLCADDLITERMAYEYLCMYPLFKPFYVFYETGSNESLADTANRILG